MSSALSFVHTKFKAIGGKVEFPAITSYKHGAFCKRTRFRYDCLCLRSEKKKKET